MANNFIPTPSTELGDTYPSAEIAAGLHPEANVHIFNTRTITSELCALVKKAKIGG